MIKRKEIVSRIREKVGLPASEHPMFKKKELMVIMGFLDTSEAVINQYRKNDEEQRRSKRKP